MISQASVSSKFSVVPLLLKFAGLATREKYVTVFKPELQHKFSNSSGRSVNEVLFFQSFYIFGVTL